MTALEVPPSLGGDRVMAGHPPPPHLRIGTLRDMCRSLQDAQTEWRRCYRARNQSISRCSSATRIPDNPHRHGRDGWTGRDRHRHHRRRDARQGRSTPGRRPPNGGACPPNTAMRTVSHETAPNSRGTTRNGNRRRSHLATLSTNSVHRVAKATTHESLIDDEADSAAASAAIHDVVTSVRTSQPLASR
jgi:hypothetical protein